MNEVTIEYRMLSALLLADSTIKNLASMISAEWQDVWDVMEAMARNRVVTCTFAKPCNLVYGLTEKGRVWALESVGGEKWNSSTESA